MVPSHYTVSAAHLFHLSRYDKRFSFVLHNHTHHDLCLCDHVPHHKDIRLKKKQRTNRALRNKYIKKPSLNSQEWFFVMEHSGIEPLTSTLPA